MPESATATATARNTGDEHKLVLERPLPAPPDRVFDAWVNPETLVKWWGPEGFSTPELSLDVSTHGKWRTVMRSPDGERHIVSGVYLAIDRPARLVFSWGWENEDGSAGHESEVELTLRAAGSGTHLKLIHRRLEHTESRDNHRLGWDSSLNDLERVFA